MSSVGVRDRGRSDLLFHFTTLAEMLDCRHMLFSTCIAVLCAFIDYYALTYTGLETDHMNTVTEHLIACTPHYAATATILT